MPTHAELNLADENHRLHSEIRKAKAEARVAVAKAEKYRQSLMKVVRSAVVYTNRDGVFYIEPDRPGDRARLWQRIDAARELLAENSE